MYNAFLKIAIFAIVFAVGFNVSKGFVPHDDEASTKPYIQKVDVFVPNNTTLVKKFNPNAPVVDVKMEEYMSLQNNANKNFTTITIPDWF